MSSQEIVALIETTLEQNHISKTDFYANCAVSRATFSQWRAGRNYPSKEALDRINDYLDLTLAVRVAPDQTEDPPPKGDGLNVEQQALMDLYDSLEPADRAVLIATARALAEARKSQGNQ